MAKALEGEKHALGELKTLGDLRWQQRILVINEPKSAKLVHELLSADTSAFRERQLLWFVIEGQTVESNYPGPLDHNLRERIQKQLGAKPGEIILMGLDGGVKARDAQLNLSTLYSLIDAMPMRRARLRD